MVALEIIGHLGKKSYVISRVLLAGLARKDGVELIRQFEKPLSHRDIFVSRPE